MTELLVRNLAHIYPGGKHALRGLSFHARPGTLGLLGPNGAGKSTLVAIMAGILAPQSGTISLGEIAPDRNPVRWRAGLGFVPQHFDFPPGLSGREILVRACLLHGAPLGEARRRTTELLVQTRLEFAADRRAARYSRGMKQRLGIACALAGSPRLLLLDEPTSGLDPAERALFRELLAERSHDRDSITLLSSHIVEDIERCCDAVVVISDGQALFSGPMTDLIERGRNKTWEFECSAEHVDTWKREGRLVALSAGSGEQMKARVVAEGPPASEALVVEPGVEDGYLELLAESRAVAAHD